MVRNLARHPALAFLPPASAALGGVIYRSWIVAGAVLGFGVLAWWSWRAASGATGGFRVGWALLGGLAALWALAQFVPYGHDHVNPPVTAEPVWDTPETRALAVRACFDCHSNETAWPWYADVAPVSWITTNHVDAGRQVLDFSSWDRAQRELGELRETIAEGEMPPAYFTLLHPAARLSATEKQRLMDGLAATVAASPPG